MTRFEEPMIKIVAFTTSDVITTSAGLDDIDVPSKGGYGDMKDTYDFSDNPFAV